MKRRRKPFEDKVKKVQKAPRIRRRLLGPGSSRSLARRVEKEEERGERAGRG